MDLLDKYTIYDLGYNKNLTKDDDFYDDEEDLNINSLNPNLLGSGDWIGNLIMSKGYLRSSNYVAGSLGWNIEFDGTAQFSDITLIGGTIKYGKTSFSDATHAGYYISADGIYLGSASDASYLKYAIATGAFTIGGGTITGGTIQTASSGKRIVISSNVLEIYNSSGTNVASLNGGGLGASEMLTIDSPSASPFYPLHIYQRGASTQSALRIDCLDTSGAGSRGMEIFQEGDKTALFIDVNSTSTGYAFEMDYAGTATQACYFFNNSASSKAATFVNNDNTNTASCVDIDQYGSGNALNVQYLKTTGGNYGIELNYDGTSQAMYIHSDNSSATQALYVTKDASSGIVAEFRNTKSSSNDYAVAAFRRTATTSTNFRKILDLDYANIWVSDGTSPNGALSGGTGDICLNGDSGKAYYCTGGTRWTAM